MYEDYLERDKGRVGAMIRHMSGDVGISFQKTLRDLYSNSDGELDDIGEVCCKWHWIVVKYALDPRTMRNYIYLIQECYRRGINLDKINFWKELLRIILPEEFLRKMESFATQVPKIAIMDDSKVDETKKEVRHSSEVLW